MQNNTIDNRITIDEIINTFSKLLKEARSNSFNLNHNINDTPAESEAQNLINKLKNHAKQ